MPRINLLPWREERRRERQQQFIVQLVLIIGLGATVVFAANLHVGQLVSYQESRNAYLNTEIAAVDMKIDEIKTLQSTKQSLIARMQVIERLQKSRPQIVHLFDELARTLPNGVYLTSIKQTGGTLEIRGTAESGARIAAYMRNIEESAWLKDPMFWPFHGTAEIRFRLCDFFLAVKQVSRQGEEGEEEHGSGRAQGL